jgi:hypothetical protein
MPGEGWLGDDCPWLLLGLDGGWLGLDEGWPEDDGGDELAVLGADGGAGVEGWDEVVEDGQPARMQHSVATAIAAGSLEPFRFACKESICIALL